jgi:mannosyltransferase OCH1-like enzyme
MNKIILHQTYKNNKPSIYDKYVNTWINFRRKFYSDEDLILIIKKYTPKYLDFFNKLRKIEKIDFIRYILMYYEGGIYADMDTVLFKPKKLKELFLKKNTIYIVIEFNKLRYQCAQSLLISTGKNNPFWKNVIEYIVKNYNNKKYITYNTGPEIFTAFVKKYKNQYNIIFKPYLFKGIMTSIIMKEYNVNNYGIIKHIKTSSWKISDYKKLEKKCLHCLKNPFLCNCYNHRWYENDNILNYNWKIIIIFFFIFILYFLIDIKLIIIIIIVTKKIMFSSNLLYIKDNNVYYYKNNYLEFKNDIQILNLFQNNISNNKYKLIKIFQNNKRSTVKLYDNGINKIVIKKYNSILNNSYYLFKEFKNLCYFHPKKITPEPILFYSRYNFFINDNYIVYKYIKNEKCENVYYNIFKCIKLIHNLGYINTDIKEKHFVWNNNKMILLDVDHHLKKNNGFFSNIFKEENVLHCIDRIPKLKLYFSKVSNTSLFLHLFKINFKKILNNLKHYLKIIIND